eukprot:9700661-Lingulodinium_polyedra.AAC.1
MDYQEEMFAEPVEELRRRLKLTPGQCVALQKAVYGLPEAPRYWWKRIHSDFTRLGFEPLVSEPCLYVTRDDPGSI